MTATFRLGRVAGIQVGVNWSVLVIFALLAWMLAAGRFPAAYPGRPSVAYLAAGLCAAVVFFLGLLAHEVAHAVVAQRNGVAVERITLWMLGGVAQLRGEAHTPGADFRIAAAGPLVSVLIGAGFSAVAGVVVAAGGHGLPVGTLAWLGGINLALAAFNLLPAAPLDGGRVLRAALWRWRGDRVWASVAAARAGRVLGLVLIGFGFWQVLVGAGFGGLWLVLIGWFVLSAAAAEEQHAQLGAALGGVRVWQVMSDAPTTAPAELTVGEFIDRYLWGFRHSTFPIVEGDRPVGLVTLARIKQVPPERRSTTLLRDVACPLEQTAVAAPDDPLIDLLSKLSRCSDGRALVLTDHHLVGIVSPSDVSRAVQHASLRGSGREGGRTGPANGRPV